MNTIQTAITQLPFRGRIEVEFFLADRLPDDHPCKAEYVQKQIDHIEENFEEIKLHKILRSYRFDYHQAACWSRRCTDPGMRILCFYELSKVYPAHYDECSKEIASAIGSGEALWLHERQKERIAVEFGLQIYKNGSCHPRVKIQFYLRQIAKSLETASTNFKTVLDAFKEPATCGIPRLRQLEDGFRDKAEAINREWNCALSNNANDRVLKRIEEKVASFQNSYQRALDPQEVGKEARKAALAVVLMAIEKQVVGWENALSSYLAFLDCQFQKQQQHDAQAIMQTLLRVNASQAHELARRRTRCNMVTAEMALEIGDLTRAEEILSIQCPSYITAKMLLDVFRQNRRVQVLERAENCLHTFEGKDRALILAHHATVTMKLDQLMAELLAQKLHVQHLGVVCTAEKQALASTKQKVAAILYPYFPNEALDLIYELLPCITENHVYAPDLDALLHKCTPFMPSQNEISLKIRSLYLDRREELSLYTLSRLAEVLKTRFPVEAKQFYEAALAKDPSSLDPAIALAALNGEKNDIKLIALLNHFIESNNSSYTTLLALLNTLDFATLMRN